MKFTAADFLNYLNDCKLYVENAPKYNYALGVVVSGVKENDIKAIARWLNRYCKNHDNISALMIFSKHESNSCNKKIIRKKKRGRPKTIVIGKKAVPHLHCLIISCNKSITSDILKSDIRAYLKKHKRRYPYINKSETKELNSLHIVKYVNKQASEQHMYGDFDFSYFLNDFYYEPKENIFGDKM